MRSIRPLFVVAGLVFLAAAAGRLQAARQAPADDLAIWKGVYTVEQAERGRSVYEAYCTRCHGLNLLGGRQGNGGGPALKDANFWLTWERATLSSLYSKISRTMPLDSPASLRDDDYVDLLALILRENGFPAGTVALAAPVMEATRVVREGGAVTEAPDFALVQVVGCLARGPADTWVLARGTAPQVTREEGSSPASRVDATSRALGPHTFRLIGVGHLDLQPRLGQRVEARGLIHRVPGDERLDVLSMETIAAPCGN